MEFYPQQTISQEAINGPVNGLRVLPLGNSVIGAQSSRAGWGRPPTRSVKVRKAQHEKEEIESKPPLTCAYI